MKPLNGMGGMKEMDGMKGMDHGDMKPETGNAKHARIASATAGKHNLMKSSDHPTEKSDSSTPKPAPKPAHDEVAKEAYALYEKEGRPQGHDKQNWLAAEAEMS